MSAGDERDGPQAIASLLAEGSRALHASAASIFLLSADRERLVGALLGWDWTRTSFVADVDDWPNVQRAMAINASIYFTNADAERGERGWFERKGIHAVICVPLSVEGRVIGVVFFDYPRSTGVEGRRHLDLGLAQEIAGRCALLVDDAEADDAPSGDRIPLSVDVHERTGS